MNIFQSKEWEECKLQTGYQKSYWVDGILVLQKNLPFGYSMLYSPLVEKEQVDSLTGGSVDRFMQGIHSIAKGNKAIFYRLELDVPKTLNSELLILNSYKKAFEEMQPEHSLVLDLTKSEEELLAEMKQKGRYNIKVAEKSGIRVESPQGGGAIGDFYELYSKTGRRHGITYRKEAYFQKLLEILGKSGYARVYKATHRNPESRAEDSAKKVLAAAIMVYSGKTAIYMFGASSDEDKNLMAPYILQWTMIRDAKAAGFQKYDFFGIAPDDQPDHPWAGVTRFKKQFGGETTEIQGSYDLVMKPLEYQVFKIAEKIRR
jgi:lipid II:glycine glycyltransferase (peptidoglycan interpeptide bridge formation enzyme)